MIVLYLIGALGLGRLIVNALPFAWHRVEAWALAVVFGYFFSAWMLLIACSLLGFPMGVAVVFALLLGCWLLPKTRRSPDRLSLATTRQSAVWLITTGLLSLAIVSVFSRQMLEPGTGGLYSIEGDLPLHLGIITSVAYATHFTWRFSIMAHTYLTYHFLIDFLSGMIVRWGGSLRSSLLLISIPLCLALVQLLFFLEYRLFRNVRAAVFFVTIFLMNGSNAGFISEAIDFLHSKSSFWAFFIEPPFDYSNYSFCHFANIITNTLVPQRAFQIGLSVFCSAMLLLLQLNREMDAVVRRRVMLFLGVLFGLLPLAHAHSFFMSFLVLCMFAVFDRGTVAVRDWLIAILTSLVIALPQLIYQMFANHHGSFVYFQPGWTFDGQVFPTLPYNVGFFLFVLSNFGIIVTLLILSYRYVKGEDVVRHLVYLGVALFTVAFVIVFQPVPYDNIKFILYAFLYFCLAIAQYLALLSRAGRWQWAPVALLLVVGGCISVDWKVRQHVLLYPNKALLEARLLRSHLPFDAMVLTSDLHEHPLWALAGQPVVEADPGSLFAYGLRADLVEKDEQAMYAGGPDAVPLLQKYRVQYVLISHYERRYLRFVNEPFFARHFPLIYRHDGMSIYQVRRAVS